VKKYLAIWRQEGGCDYTIGCGFAEHMFEAPDLDAATTYVIEQLSNPELSDDVAGTIYKVDVYETIGIGTTLVSGVWQAERQRKQAAARRARDDHERAEYERLRKKFER
jgi:hypothetical protein